jgi:hypothetical protein
MTVTRPIHEAYKRKKKYSTSLIFQHDVLTSMFIMQFLVEAARVCLSASLTVVFTGQLVATSACRSRKGGKGVLAWYMTTLWLMTEHIFSI